MNIYINKEDKFNFKGKVYTFEEFKEEHAIQADNQAIGVLKTLVKKGSVKIIEPFKSKQQQALEQASKEEAIRELADAIDAEEESIKDFKAQKKREDRATYELIEVEYPSYSKAYEAQQFFAEKLRLDNIDIVHRGALTLLAFHDITDSDLNFINRTYMADKAINATVGVVNNGVEAVTGSVDYVARKVVSPTLQIGAKASASLLKSLAHTVAKTGATLISAGSQGVKETKNAIMTDPDVIRAGRELIDAKDGIVRTVGGKTGASSGIRIVR